MKDYKVETFDLFGKDKQKYFRTREGAEAYAESLQVKRDTDIFILQRENGFWYCINRIRRN